jgi:hypothetical protein
LGALYPDMARATISYSSKALLSAGRRPVQVANMPNAKFLPFPSICGHFAGGPGTNPDDVKFLDTALKELLASQSTGPEAGISQAAALRCHDTHHLARKALFMRRDLCHSGSEPDRSFVAYSSLRLMLATRN